MTELRVVSPSQDLEKFLSYLYDGLDGYVYSATKRDDAKFEQSFFHWPVQRDELIAHINSTTSEAEVYVAPAVFSAPHATKPNFKATNVVWAEFDGKVPTVLGDTPDPTLRVLSSQPGHEHWYWRLAEPATSADSIEQINRSLTYTLGADASGWDINQILRPPSTTNHKRNKIVQLLALSDAAYNIVAFSAVPQAPAVAPEIDSSVIPDVSDVVLKYAWSSEAITLYKTRDPEDRSVALMRLGYYCAEMGMSDVEIFSVIRNADDRWGKFKNRTDRDRRLTDLISKVRIKVPTAETETLQAYGFEDLLSLDYEIDWLIPGLLEAQGYMLLTGPSGVGKSQFTLRMCIALALGRKWLGFEVEKPIKIMFMSLEMHLAQVKYFLSLMAKTLDPKDKKLLQENFVIVPRGEALYLDSPGSGRDELEALIEKHQPAGVVIDSLGSTTTGDISSEGPVRSVMDYNDRLRNKYNIFTWFIHHNRKASGDNKKPKKMEDVYGNQYIVNRATTVYCLWPGKDNIEVIPLKKRLAELESPWFIKRVEGLDFRKQEITFTEKTTQELVYKAPIEPDAKEEQLFKEETQTKPNPDTDGMLGSM